MCLTISLPVLTFTLLSGYQAGLEIRYENIQERLLVVQETGSMGEFYGSRLPDGFREELLRLGAGWVAAEIHTITGTSPENAILLRGVELDNYARIEEFKIVDGRPLTASDPPRAAMIGVKLAEERNVFPGEKLNIRGREFSVIGIMSNGTYADYEAWISVIDAQNLLGWGSDVSVFVIPDDELFDAGDELSGGVSIVQKGESGQDLLNEWKPFFKLLKVIIATLAASVAVSLTTVLWRIAWLSRRDLAILQSLGFKRIALMVYLFVQGLGITIIGFCLGIGEAFVISGLIPLRTAGISIDAVFNLNVIAASVVFSGLITLAGTSFPVFWFSRQNLVQLMRVEG